MLPENVQKHLTELIHRYPQLDICQDEIIKAYYQLEATLHFGQIFICGNGGSAADAEHIVGELMKNFVVKRQHSVDMQERFAKAGETKLLKRLEPGLRAYSLLSHPALMSAFANDVDPNLCYAQQLYVQGKVGDTVIGISTSGNAENVYNCLKTAKAMGINTILLTGMCNGKCCGSADIIIHAPAYETYKIQEYHLPIYHTLCKMLESRFFE